MIVKKYAHVDDIGIALFVTDLIMIIIACFVFDIKTALYSFVGLTLKSFLIDAIIENIMLRKSIMITCDDKDSICHFITDELEKGATIVEATGAYTNEKRYLIFTTLTRKQAAALRFSMGRITLPHQLARLVLAEQIYRACTINHGLKYHK